MTDAHRHLDILIRDFVNASQCLILSLEFLSYDERVRARSVLNNRQEAYHKGPRSVQVRRHLEGANYETRPLSAVK